MKLKLLYLITCSFLLLIFTGFLNIEDRSNGVLNLRVAKNDILLTDAFGIPLTDTSAHSNNIYNQIPLTKIPPLLTLSVIESEDRRFKTHSGFDLRGKFAAALFTIFSDTRRGGSTITEQVIRIAKPRPRTLWSKYLEALEAMWLEAKLEKDQILEYYLNQVPYGGNRKGVKTASRFYFGKNLSDLNNTELLALAVLVQAPSRLNPRNNPGPLQNKVQNFSNLLLSRGKISKDTHELITKSGKLDYNYSENQPVSHSHFLRFAKDHLEKTNVTLRADSLPVSTTLNLNMQRHIGQLVKTQLDSFSGEDVKNCALMIMDYRKNEITSWISATSSFHQETSEIDSILVPRQVGSSLKPFVYAAAFDRGLTPASTITDEPLIDTVGFGLHYFKNYSSKFYGEISLKEALANSLNIPAVKVLRHVGYANYINVLAKLGIKSLKKDPTYYSDGLALGSGEISLYEMMGAYAALARGGIYQTPRIFKDLNPPLSPQIAFSENSASQVTQILLDRDARRLEFGRDSLLSYSRDTAVKTGTSSEHRDAWIFGYNSQFLVGIWMGALDYTPMNKITGARGPAVLLKNVFKALEPYLTYKKPLINAIPVTQASQLRTIRRNPHIKIIQPSPNLHLAINPRIPASHQKFKFLLSGIENNDSITWTIGEEIIKSGSEHFNWPLRRGQHELRVSVTRENSVIYQSEAVPFVVK